MIDIGHPEYAAVIDPDTAFKAKVVLDALKGEQPLVELSQRYHVHPNQITELGEGIFGIEAAARHYFGKGAVSLTAQEAARLAAVLPNPRRFNPTGSVHFVTGRAERIHQIMVRRGIVIPEYEELMTEPAEPVVMDAPEPGADQGEDGSATVPDEPDVGERPNDMANADE